MAAIAVRLAVAAVIACSMVVAAPRAALGLPSGWTGPTSLPLGAGRPTIPSGVDGNGKLHIASWTSSSVYCEQGIWYATNKSGAWTHDVVTCDGHRESLDQLWSLDVTADAKVYLLIRRFADVSTHTGAGWYVATNATGSWSLQKLPMSSSTIVSGRLRVRDGKLHIVDTSREPTGDPGYYYYRLRYLTNASGDWVSTIIPGTGHFVTQADFRLDSEGVRRIVYRDAGADFDKAGLNLVSYRTAWTVPRRIAPVRSGDQVTLNPSIALDEGGGIHVGYFWKKGYAPTATYAACYVGSRTSWTKQCYSTNDVDSHDPLPAADASGKAHLVWWVYAEGNTECKLKWATNRSGSWVVQSLYTDPVEPGAVSVTVRSQNKVNVFFTIYGTVAWVREY